MASIPITKVKPWNKRRARHSDPFYRSKRWLSDSERHRKDKPICECGCGRPSKNSDHIIRWKIGGMIWDKINRRMLSSTCHGSKTAKESNGYTYDYIITPTGLRPVFPLRWIKVPGELKKFINKHTYKKIHDGTYFKMITEGGWFSSQGLASS